MAVMGRPKSDNPKVKNVTIRLTEEEYQEVVRYSSEHNQTITKTLKEGFQLVKEQEKT